LSLKALWISRYLKDDLPWYFAVADNEKPAKFLIADRVPVDFSDDDDVDALVQVLQGRAGVPKAVV